MKRLLSALALSAAFAPVYADVLTFDDVAGIAPNTYGAMPVYKGFTFNCTGCGVNRLDWIDTVGSSWNYGSVSGEYTLLNNYGGTGVIRAADGSDFSYDGLWSRVWGSSGERHGKVRGFNNGVEIWTQDVVLGNSFAHVGGVTGAVDELRLDFGNFFLVDDLALNQKAGDVPEPATLALGGLALVGMGLARRRKA